MLPKILKNYNLFLDGAGMAGLAEEVTLPKLERKMEAYRGAGMLGEVELDLGMTGLSLEFTLAEYHRAVLSKWATPGVDGIQARFMAALQQESGDANTSSYEVTVRGRWKELDSGNVKNGDLSKLKVVMPLSFYQLTMDGEVVHKIDLVNGIEIIDGVDRSAELRAAIGLTAS